MSKKIVKVSWSALENGWTIKFWSDVDREFKFDSFYPVKEMDPNGIGFVSESLLIKLRDLHLNYGYIITFEF